MTETEYQGVHAGCISERDALKRRIRELDQQVGSLQYRLSDPANLNMGRNWIDEHCARNGCRAGYLDPRVKDLERALRNVLMFFTSSGTAVNDQGLRTAAVEARLMLEKNGGTTT